MNIAPAILSFAFLAMLVAGSICARRIAGITKNHQIKFNNIIKLQCVKLFFSSKILSQKGRVFASSLSISGHNTDHEPKPAINSQDCDDKKYFIYNKLFYFSNVRLQKIILGNMP